MILNTETFKDNFLQHYRPLCMYALHYLKDIDNAEDMVQDCFTELWERKDSCVNISDIKPYLYTMVRNRCIDILRKESYIDNNIQPSDIEGIISDEECEERSYDEARMWTAIDSLPEKCREVFLFAKRDGMKYEDIAEKMNISINTVRNHMNKALKIIKEGAHRIYMFFFG